jgi:hypothetical protein
MIIRALEKTTKAIIFNPLTLLPMLIAVIIAKVSTNLTSFIFERPISEMLLYYETVMSSDFISIFLARYPIEILVMFLSIFIVLLVIVLGLVSLVNYAKGKSIVDSINDSFINFKKAFFLTFFGIIILFLSLISFVIIQSIFNFIYNIFPADINNILSLFILPLIMFIIFVIYLTKLSFVLPASQDNNIREAIKSSWEFTDNKFVNAFAYLLIVMIIIGILTIIITNMGIFLELNFIFEAIADIIGMTFFGLSISYYYFNK